MMRLALGHPVLAMHARGGKTGAAPGEVDKK